MIDQSRRNSFESFKLLLRCMSDIEYQKRIWIRAEGPEVDSFCEFINCFCDSIDFIIDNAGIYQFSDEQIDTLNIIRAKFNDFYPKNRDEEEFIDSQEWKEMRELAAETLKVLNVKN